MGLDNWTWPKNRWYLMILSKKYLLSKHGIGQLDLTIKDIGVSWKSRRLYMGIQWALRIYPPIFDVGLSENSTYPYPTSIVFISIQFHTYPRSIVFCHIPWEKIAFWDSEFSDTACRSSWRERSATCPWADVVWWAKMENRAAGEWWTCYWTISKYL